MGIPFHVRLVQSLLQKIRCYRCLWRWCFQMSMMELATIKQHNIPIKIVVMTNKRLGMVRELQTKLYEDNQVAVSLGKS